MANVKKNKKTGKWSGRVYYTDESEVGRARYKSKKIPNFDTKKEAEVAYAELQVKLDNQNTFKAEYIIFSDYFEKWCETHKLGKYSESTENRYLREIRYVKDFFKDTTLTQLNRQRYQDYINWRGTDNGKDTVEKAHGSLKSCVQQARADGLITIDPSYGISLNYDNESSDRIKYWNLKDTKKLGRYFKDNLTKLNMMLFIAITTGLRIGEIYALCWDNFDFKQQTLTVKAGYDYNLTKDFTNAKNVWSKRTIVITDELIKYIKKYRFKYQKEHPDYLFLHPDKQPIISHNGLTKHLKKVCRELNVDELTIHSLRHSHCSLLIYKEVSIHYISKRLGHKNVIETLKTYSHIVDEMEQKQDTKIIEVLESIST
jgi:integrase